METKMTASSLKSITMAVAALAAIVSCPAQAEENVAVGQLTCGVKGGVSFVIGSTKKLRWVFRVNPDDPRERYEGKIEKFGIDAGVTDHALLTLHLLTRSNL